MTGPKIDAIWDRRLRHGGLGRVLPSLGLDFPAGCESEPHAEASLGPSMRLMLDTEAMLRQIDLDWTASPAGRVGLAVRLPSPAAVDELYDELAAVDLGVRVSPGGRGGPHRRIKQGTGALDVLFVLDVGLAVEYGVPQQPVPPTGPTTHDQDSACPAEGSPVGRGNAAIDALTYDARQIARFRQSP